MRPELIGQFAAAIYVALSADRGDGVSVNLIDEAMAIRLAKVIVLMIDTAREPSSD